MGIMGKWTTLAIVAILIVALISFLTILQENAFAQMNFFKADATIFIRDDATGGDCTGVGIWDDINNVCFLTTNLTESVVLADNGVFLDCQFHSITGSGVGGSIGVDADTKRRVALKNCIISNFDRGIFFSRVARGSSFNNEVFGNIVGMEVEGSRGISISSTNAHDNSEDGIFVTASRKVVIFNSNSNENGKNGIVFENVRGGNIQTSGISGNTEDGIFLQGAVNIRIRFLNANDNGDDGISLNAFTERNTVTNVNFVLNGGNGIHIDGGNDNNISANASTDNTGDGLRITDGDINTIIGNFFNRNGQDGFFAANAANNNAINNNVANDNADDGFHDGRLPLKDIRLFNTYSDNTCSGNGDMPFEPPDPILILCTPP